MATSIYRVAYLLPRLLEGLRTRGKGQHRLSGVATGLHGLDELTGGLQGGDLIVIGGRPSMGKTALACQIALHAALDLHVPVIYFSLDLGRQKLALRLTAATASVDLHRLCRSQPATEDWPRVEAASQTLSCAPFYLDDTAVSIGDLCTRSRHAANDHGIGLIVVDSCRPSARTTWTTDQLRPSNPPPN